MSSKVKLIPQSSPNTAQNVPSISAYSPCTTCCYQGKIKGFFGSKIHSLFYLVPHLKTFCVDSGVEDVIADSKAHKVVVKGKKAAADPMKVVERVQKKTGRKVELLSPLPPPPEEKKEEEKKEEPEPPKPEEKKEVKDLNECTQCSTTSLYGNFSFTSDLAKLTE